MMNRIILLLVLAAIAANAHAGKPWSFAGIQMGEPLASSHLPSCPLSDSYKMSWVPPTAICVTSVGDRNADGTQIANLDGLTALHWPELYGGSWVSLQDGRVATIRVHIGHSAFEAVEKILTARYGKPASVVQSEVTSNGGATVSSSSVTWHEDGNTISLTERCERIDRSCVDVINDALAAASADASKGAAQKAASIL